MCQASNIRRRSNRAERQGKHDPAMVMDEGVSGAGTDLEWPCPRRRVVPRARFRAGEIGEGAEARVVFAFRKPEEGCAVKETVLIASHLAIIDDGDHVGDGERDEIGTVLEGGTEIERDGILGIARIGSGLGELMQGHFAEFKDEAGGVPDKGAVGEAGVEYGDEGFGRGDAVLSSRGRGAIGGVGAEGLSAFLDETGDEVRRGG